MGSFLKHDVLKSAESGGQRHSREEAIIRNKYRRAVYSPGKKGFFTFRPFPELDKDGNPRPARESLIINDFSLWLRPVYNVVRSIGQSNYTFVALPDGEDAAKYAGPYHYLYEKIYSLGRKDTRYRVFTKSETNNEGPALPRMATGVILSGIVFAAGDANMTTPVMPAFCLLFNTARDALLNELKVLSEYGKSILAENPNLSMEDLKSKVTVEQFYNLPDPVALDSGAVFTMAFQEAGSPDPFRVLANAGGAAGGAPAMLTVGSVFGQDAQGSVNQLSRYVCRATPMPLSPDFLGHIRNWHVDLSDVIEGASEEQQMQIICNTLPPNLVYQIMHESRWANMLPKGFNAFSSAAPGTAPQVTPVPPSQAALSPQTAAAALFPVGAPSTPTGVPMAAPPAPVVPAFLQGVGAPVPPVDPAATTMFIPSGGHPVAPGVLPVRRTTNRPTASVPAAPAAPTAPLAPPAVPGVPQAQASFAQRQNELAAARRRVTPGARRAEPEAPPAATESVEDETPDMQQDAPD